jgi:uncharacterized protein YfiM (DUF2279 family)
VRESIVGVAVGTRAGLLPPEEPPALLLSGGVGGSVITMLGSRNLTWRSARRDAAGAGAGVAMVVNLRRRARRKAKMAMESVKLVAMSTKRVWNSRPERVAEAGGARSVCAGDSMIRERSERGYSGKDRGG